MSFVDLHRVKEVSELRQDPISRDWVIISTVRAKRPESYKSLVRQEKETPIEACPFENPAKFGNEVVKIYESKNGDWDIQVIKNKFPIVSGNNCSLEERRGPYLVKPEASGYHEVVITRDHKRTFAQMSVEQVYQVLNVYKERYEELKKLECADYILIIHNHGLGAAASVSHPHSQILAIPFVPSDIKRSLYGAKNYYAEKNRCGHCDVLEWELKEKTRIVFENKLAMSKVPYVPRFSYALKIFPKKHNACFENSSEEELKDMAEALKISLAKIHHGLNNPPYNFFIHTAPVGRAVDYSHYHWHLEIAPRLSSWGGFELGTGADVIDTDPDDAAEYLRNIAI